MPTTSEQIRKEIEATKLELEESIDDTHKTLYGEIKRTQDRMLVVEGQLRGRARTANEVTAQVFASGHFEALLRRLDAIERAMLALGRRMLELEKAQPERAEELVNDLDDEGSW